MQKYHFESTDKFESDMNEAVDYITNVLKNPVAANKLAHDIYKAIDSRLYYPTALSKFNDKYYVINVRNRQIFYTVDEHRQIMTVEFMYYCGWNG